MLPDFLEIKKKIELIMLDTVKDRIRRDPIIGKVRGFRQHEGGDCSFEQIGGPIKEFEYKEIRGEFSLDRDEASKMGLGALLGKAVQIGDQLLGAQTRMLFKSINEAVDHTGNKVQGELTPALFLDALEKVPISFNPDGTPNLPMVVVNPEMGKALAPQLEHWNDDREINDRFHRLIEIKREEWRADEGRRKLVR